MSSFIPIANHAGAVGLHFAWPMLWQSSLLFGGLLLLEARWRRRLRPSLRYSLWSVAMLKLLLPPSFALPTSPAWWFPHKAVSEQHISSVSFSPLPAPAPMQMAHLNTAPSAPAATRSVEAHREVSLSIPGALFLVWLVGGLLLIGGALRRWRMTSRVLAKASSAPPHLVALMNQTRELLAMPRAIPLKLSSNVGAPAVAGLVRPVILLPIATAANMEQNRLRSVLLHELIHVRRRDLWANLFQNILQVMYWWHPLVWVVTARIRRIREQVVDEAVLKVLGGSSTSYIDALLESARLALTPALPHLGLLGILESGGPLRERVEHLLEADPCAYRRQRWHSAVAVLLLGLLVLPMGLRPTRAQAHPPAAALAAPATASPLKAAALPAQPLEAVPPTVTPPLVTLATRFALVTEAGDEDIGLDWLFGQSPTNNPSTQRATAADLFATPAPTQAHTNDTANLRVDLLRVEGQSAVLTAGQSAELRNRLSIRKGTELTGDSKVTTFSGRQASLCVTEQKTLVTGAETSGKGINYQTDTVGFGPELDALPVAQGTNWLLQLRARQKEFLGYDDPKTDQLAAVTKEGQVITGVKPLPHTRILETSATTLASPGQTVVLRGPLTMPTPRGKSGFFTREPKAEPGKRLYVFVTIERQP